MGTSWLQWYYVLRSVSQYKQKCVTYSDLYTSVQLAFINLMLCKFSQRRKSMLSKIPYKITMKKVDGKKRGKENVTARPVARSTKGGLG